jgi:branched-subunit amino acid transport protein
MNMNHINDISRALLEKLIVPQLVKKFLAFYRTVMFTAIFTKSHH